MQLSRCRYIYHIVPVIIFFFTSTGGSAQHRITLYVKDSLNKAVSEAYIFVSDDYGTEKSIVSDEGGKVVLVLEKSTYSFRVQHISFQPYVRHFFIDRDSTLHLFLKDKLEKLQEVIVTAKETNKFTSVSVIGSTAMQHIQPSSLSDLLSLVPGGNTSAPVLNRKNPIKLREVGISSTDYASSSLGTSFVIDGIPINTDANMQETVGGKLVITPGSWYADAKRNSTRYGVDMRSISTDDIEKVEIVRGIPSVRYGNLSSGLVRIERKKGMTKWKSRIKADGFSKLLYLGKGFSLTEKGIGLNIGLDYLDARPDPRNEFENYKRYTASARMEKVFSTSKHPVMWKVNVDYTGTLDEEKSNPDIGYDKYESYRSSYNRLRLSNHLDMDFDAKVFKSVSLKTSYSQSKDEIKQSKWVQVSTASTLPVNTGPGEHYGIFAVPAYVSQLRVEGKPMDFFADLSTRLGHDFENLKGSLLLGAAYTLSGNGGQGQVYDLTLPPSPDMATRPRAFRDIPALQKFSGYVESTLEWQWDRLVFSVRAGLRSLSLMGLDRAYVMGGKTYMSPRINAKATLPKIIIGQKTLQVDIRTGWGKHRQSPTQNLLYPQESYRDFVQLNYYHNNKAFRQVHFKTYVFPQVNYALEPTMNDKREVGLDLNYHQNSISITYFDENMPSGFRKMYDFSPVSFKKYDASGIDPTSLSQAPLVDGLPFQKHQALVLFNKETNGSSIRKKGVEFQFFGRRFESLKTRLTFNAAWFKTKYFNSLPVYRFPSKTVINGKKYYHLGLYKEEDSYIREQLSSSLVVDTYIPSLHLKTSLTADCNWYYLKRQAPQDGIPTHYVDEGGKTHPYGPLESQDAILQWLTIDYNTNLYKTYRTPFSSNIHLKITKDFYKSFNVSMYVSRLLSFYRDNHVGGTTIQRRGTVSPYFGMEMNINL